MVKINVGTAASIPMILQTVIPAVSLSDKSLSIEITGGTDVKKSPTTDYLRYNYKGGIS
jgi:RNA 3'-terminal phosphate cyclase (ATP)